MRRPAGIPRTLAFALACCFAVSGAAATATFPTRAAPAGVSATAGASATTDPAPEPTVAQLIGQKLVIRMDTVTPSASLLGRVGRGEVGGIVLFGSRNISTRTALLTAVDRLQAAARDGSQPPLLIMADQEGGGLRTIPWAPTSSSARAMGANGGTTFVRAKGRATGKALLASGVNVDLAPVADVAHGSSGFMYLARRTFSRTSSVVARLAAAFARGLADRGVIAAMKHFPGIGRVRLNTDRNVQVVTASRAQLTSDLAPFRAGIRMHVPMIMLSNATYPAYDGANAAGWSHAIGIDLLRTELGFRGVTITDSLNGTAAARHVSAVSLAYKAVQAGTDMIMLTGKESGTDAQFAYLVAKAESGRIPLDMLRASWDRIVALKAALAQ